MGTVIFIVVFAIISVAGSLAALLRAGGLRDQPDRIAGWPRGWDLYPSTFVDGEGKPLPPGDDPIDRMWSELEVAEYRQVGQEPHSSA
jgi:hypothetical protein